MSSKLIIKLKFLEKKIREIEMKINELNEKSFIKQIKREDILINMLSNINKSGKELFDLLLNENEKVDETRQGWIFETICQILITLKCIHGINYTELYDGQLQNLKQITDINSILQVKIAGGGNNKSDMTIKEDKTLIAFTIKYKNKYCETDVSKLDNTITKQNIPDDYKIGLIVKDKDLIIKHRYKNKLNIDKQLHDKIRENSLLFDKKDIIKGLDVFCQRFSNKKLSIEQFIEMANSEYLFSPRKQLTKKLHQKMTELKFIESLKENKYKKWCIAHKPRSGKSITMLSICKYLLENGYKKILIMTPVASTIYSFKDDLEKYIDFKNIKYCFQENLNKINKQFNGIVFSSVQYLKNGSNKKDYLKNVNFDVIITDESHLGSSTNKTKTEILEADNESIKNFDELCKKIKLNIFSSGTAEKTKKYYKIHDSCVFEWELEDEGFMKSLNKEVSDDIIKNMTDRHGIMFKKCFEDNTLEKDYLKYPSQILMKHVIHQSLINDIKIYNEKNGTNFGYSCSSLFALRQITNDKGEIEYANEFELCKDNSGIEILKGFLEYIISDNEMDNTLMKQIEHTQSTYNSRKSTRLNPLMFIIYLPTHTRNNTIDQLQITLKKFLETYNLWNQYNIEYSSSKGDTGYTKETYNELIKSFMRKTRVEKKKGCILLLGDQGTVGVTYHDCDVTISLDDGHNIDNQKQRFARALTEAENKKVGINVDMNIQRTYTCLNDIIQRYRKNSKTTKTNAEILYYLYEQKIFLFNPQEFNCGRTKEIEIKSFYQKESENIIKEIDDSHFLDNIICDDDMKHIIKLNTFQSKQRNVNTDLNGENQDCPKGDKQKYEIDSPKKDNYEKEDEKSEEYKEESEDEEDLINKTFELCRSFLFHLLSLISRSFNIFDYKDIFINNETKKIIKSALEDKKIDLNHNNYNNIINIMNTIIDNNNDIINNIREIYRTASPDKLRYLISKHFIPTKQEKKDNAEIPTPVELVDEMLDKIPNEFWTSPKKVFEPCCGKGNFVLGIFDRFFKGLEKMYPDTNKRCNIIINECIYYSDLTSLNIFITTELLKCHTEKYSETLPKDKVLNKKLRDLCSTSPVSGETSLNYNNYIGDTLKLNIKNIWNIEYFDLVVGNPPYQESENGVSKGGGNNLYTKFIYFADSILIKNSYLLFINPPTYFSPGRSLNKNNINLRKDILNNYYYHYINLEECSRHFNVGSKFIYYLIQKISSTNDKLKIICKYNKKIYETVLEQKLLIRDYLPYLLNKTSLEILDKIKNNNNQKLNIFNSTVFDKRRPYVLKRNKKETDEEYKQRAKQSGFIYPIQSTGIQIVYSSKKCKNQNDKKVLMSESGYLRPFYDNGILGVGGHCFACLVDDENKGKKIIELLNSKLYTFYININKWSGFHNKNVLQDLPNIIDEIDTVDDNIIYKYFEITKEEIKLIEENI